MSRYRLQRFCDPGFLGEIDPPLLTRFLKQYSEFFARHDIALDPGNDLYRRLIRVFCEPPADIPDDLIDALYYLDDVSDRQYHDNLAEQLNKYRSVALGTAIQDWSTIDIAITLWLENPKAVERIHAEQLLVKQTGLEYYYVGLTELPRPPKLTPALEDKIALALKDPLRTLQKGNAVEVFSFDRGDDVVFVVNFGTAYQRALKIENGETKAFGYRPVEHAVLFYHRKDGEACIRAKGKTVTKAVIEAIGRHYLGEKHALVAATTPAKFNLNVLRERGQDTLACASSDDIAVAELTEIRWRRGGPLSYRENHAAVNLFMAFDEFGTSIPWNAKLLSATITFQRTRNSKPRKVRLMFPNRASYDHEGDAAFVEPWLKANGLINPRIQMVPTPIHCFWSAFEQQTSFAASFGEWKEQFDGSMHLLRPVLVDDGRPVEIVVLKTQRDLVHHGRYRVVTHRDGSLTAVAEAVEAPAVPVTKSQTAAWRLDVCRLSATLANVLGITPQFEELANQTSVWQIGVDVPIEGVRIPLLLVKPQDEQHLHAVLDGVAARELTSAIILIPTRRTFSVELGERARRHDITCLFWDDVLFDAKSDGFGFTPVWGDALRQVRQHVLPPDTPVPATYHTPPGSTWADVKMRFVDHGRETVRIKVKDRCVIYTCEGMGMASQKNSKPTKPWEFLQALALLKDGVFSWRSDGAHKNRRSHRDQLSRDLRKFFGIEADPLPYEEDAGGWVVKFSVQDFDDSE